MLLELYLKKMSNILPELKIAIDENNYKNISLLSHSIKGSSANFRIDFLQTLAQEMEAAAKSELKGFDYKEALEDISKYIEDIKIV